MILMILFQALLDYYVWSCMLGIIINTWSLDPEEILSEEPFESNGVGLTLEWVEGNSTYSYHIDIAPYQVLPFFSFGSASIKYKIPYNTAYNVSVLATTSYPCAQNVTQWHKPASSNRRD